MRTKNSVKRVLSFLLAITIICGFVFSGVNLYQFQKHYYETYNNKIPLESFGSIVNVKGGAPYYGKSIDEYLKNNADISLIKNLSDTMKQADALRVKQIFVDKSKLPDNIETIEDYWSNESKYEGYLKMNESVQILYDPSEESPYYIALANPIDAINCSVVFTRSNMNGECVDGCLYDAITGITYIPKELITNDGIASVQAEVFYLCDGDNPTNKVDVNGSNGNEGYADLYALDDVIKLSLDSLIGNEKIDSKYLNVKLNDHVVGEEFYWCYFDEDTKSNILCIKYPGSAVYSIDCDYEKPGLIKRVWDYLVEFWDAPVVNAGTFEDMNVASGAWAASGGVPSSGTLLVIDGVKVEYGDYTANGKTYIPTTENKLSDQDLAKMASIITSGGSTSINGQYFAAGNFQVYKVTIPAKSMEKNGITYHIPASTYILHCSHSSVNAISGTPNTNPGKVIVNFMGVSNGYALIGMYTEFPGYTQEGVGYFRIPLETDSNAIAHMDIHKTYSNNSVSNAIFVVVPAEKPDLLIQSTNSFNQIKKFLGNIYSHAGISNEQSLVKWEVAFFNGRGFKQTYVGILQSFVSDVFASRVHAEKMPDGTTEVRFNTVEDENYVMSIIAGSLHDVYQCGPSFDWVYTAAFTDNADLNVYKAISDLINGPDYMYHINPDLLLHFFVDPESKILTTDVNGNASLDVFMGTYLKNKNSTITKNFKYKEIFGGVNNGKIDTNYYSLDITFNSTSSGATQTYMISDSTGATLVNKQDTKIHLVNTLGVSSNEFINPREDVYIPASISLNKYGNSYYDTYVQTENINNNSYEVTKFKLNNIPVTGAAYKVTDGTNTYSMQYSNGKYTYGNLVALVGTDKTYKIYESSAPSGYNVSPEYWEVTVRRNVTHEVDHDVYKDEIASIVYYHDSNSKGSTLSVSEPLKAYDSLKSVTINVNKTLSKAISTDSAIDYEKEIKKSVFGIYTQNPITLGDSTVDKDTLVGVTAVNNATIGEDSVTGTATFNNLPDGKYYVKELAGSEKFILDTSTNSVSVNRGSATTYSVGFTNMTGSISVKKSIPTNDTFDVEKVTFKLYKDINNNKVLDDDLLLSTGSTKSDGTVSWDNNINSLSLGNYILYETYKKDTGITCDGKTFTYDVTNASQWTKFDSSSYYLPFSLEDKESKRDVAFEVVNDSLEAEYRLVKNTTTLDVSKIDFELYKDGILYSKGTCNTTGKKDTNYDVIWSFNGKQDLKTLRLPVGEYELREYIPESYLRDIKYTYMCPDGFNRSEDGSYFYKKVLIVNTEEPIKEVVTNTRCEGSINLKKLSETDKISGVGFKVYYMGNGTEPCENYKKTMLHCSEERFWYETNNDGQLIINNLPYGWYEIEEMLPKGNKIVWDGPVSTNGNRLVYVGSEGPTDVAYVTAKNVINISVVVNKKDLWSLDAVGGAAFNLYKDLNNNHILDKEEEGTYVRKYDTDKDGLIVFENLSKGNYILREYQTVEGYYISGEDYYITIDNDVDKQVDVLEEPYSVPIIIYKEDANNPNHLLTGATFELYEDSDFNAVFDKSKDSVALCYGGNSGSTRPVTFHESVIDGKTVYVSDPVKPGNYFIYEAVPPVGFDYIDSPVTYISIDIEDTSVSGFYVNPIEVTIKNICEGSIHITKVDEEYPDRKLSGAIFTVYEDSNNNSLLDEEDSIVGEMNEVSEGEYLYENLPYGSYFVTETESPEGYLLREDVWNVFISENNEIYDIKDSDFEGIGNRFSGSVRIYKVDSSDTDVFVSGATFALYDGDRNLVTYIIDENNGVYECKNLKRGTYYIREEKAPLGYSIDEDEYAFEITNEAYEVVVDNSSKCGVKGKFLEYKPTISTTLTNDSDNSHTILKGNKVSLTDKVYYEGLIPGLEYEVTGTLMEKRSGKEFSGSNKVTVKFTPQTTNGYVSVHFNVDTTKLEGSDLVAFEKVYVEGKLVASHEDLNSPSQTVSLGKVNTPSTGENNNIYIYSILGVIAVMSSVMLLGINQKKKD